MAGSPTKSVIAVFDFDDTLITRDTLMDFLFRSDAFSLGTKLTNGLKFLPVFISFKLGRITNSAGKQQLLKLFTTGRSNNDWLKRCQTYASRLEQLTNPMAVAKLNWHRTQGHTVVIESASIQDWILPWAKAHGVEHVIATKLEVVDGTLTGKFATPNCFGREKVVRFLAEFPDRKNHHVIMYGDGHSDQDMFKMADEVFERRFN